MGLIKNKKGIFFISLALIVLSIFVLTVTFLPDFNTRSSVQKRVESLDSFIFSIKQDLPRQLYVFGFRTLFLIEEDIVENNTYANDVNGLFQEAFFSGSLNGNEENLLEGAKFSDIQDELQRRAQAVSSNITLSSPILTVSQDDPWNVKLTLTADFLAEDLGGSVKWDKEIVINSYIPIENFEDPLYLINTNGLVPNKMVKTPHDSFVTENDVSNLNDHLGNSYYITSTTGPSFLNRLEGNIIANPQGIESLVNLQNLSSQGISVKQKSVVDYIYFSTNNPTNCNVQPSGMPSWFRLDNEHLATYEVNCA